MTLKNSKIIAAALSMGLVLSACGNNEETPAETPAETPTETAETNSFLDSYPARFHLHFHFTRIMVFLSFL